MGLLAARRPQNSASGQRQFVTLWSGHQLDFRHQTQSDCEYAWFVLSGNVSVLLHSLRAVELDHYFKNELKSVRNAEVNY
jgi:hypothetical protein